MSLRSCIKIKITNDEWNIDPADRKDTFAISARMYRPRGPYGPLTWLRGRHKSPGITANNMRAKFISPVDSYVTALLYPSVLRGSPGTREGGERRYPRETAFAWKYAGWLSTLENLSAIDYTPRGKQYVRGSFPISFAHMYMSSRYGRYSYTDGRLPVASSVEESNERHWYLHT